MWSMNWSSVGCGASLTNAGKPTAPTKPPVAATALICVVGDRSSRGDERFDVGVREDDRRRRALDGVHCRSIAGVGAVDDDSSSVQTLDQGNAEVAESGVGSLFTSVADSILDVVGKLDDANAELLVDRDQVEIVLDWCSALQVEDDAEASGLFDCIDIGG